MKPELLKGVIVAESTSDYAVMDVQLFNWMLGWIQIRKSGLQLPCRVPSAVEDS